MLTMLAIHSCGTGLPELEAYLSTLCPAWYRYLAQRAAAMVAMLVVVAAVAAIAASIFTSTMTHWLGLMSWLPSFSYMTEMRLVAVAVSTQEAVST